MTAADESSNKCFSLMTIDHRYCQSSSTPTAGIANHFTLETLLAY